MPRNILCLVLLLTPLLPGQVADENLVAPLRWRGIGPANMMGRIAAIDALDEDYRTVLVASASGGVFLSRSAGLSWQPIFDRYGAGSIGSVKFFQPNPDIIWVGTGESANRNSSGWGDGIYKSTDAGRSFTNMGLGDTNHVAEIAVHPSDPDIVWAAAVGHLWGYSGSRGLYKTTDGGATWQKLTNGLPDDGKTGCTEIIIDPRDPNTLFAGMYHRLRGPATMHSGGPDGGIYKTTDGGDSWRKLTNGLPAGDIGMIDLSIHLADPRIMVAAVEADENLPRDMSVPGTGVYRSDDGGESWQYLLRHATRPFYHGQIEIDPLDPDRIFVVSRDFRTSRDGGKTWGGKWFGGGGDDHDLWISPTDSSVFYTATDQGAYLTVDDGETLIGFDNMAIGQYYAIGVDMRDPYWVVGGLQDNGIWAGPSNSREGRGILNLHNTWVGEGDGFHSQVDPTDWRTMYFVNHVGFAARLDIETREHSFITPTPETVTNFADWVDHDYPETPTRYTISPGEHWFFRDRPGRPLLPPQFRFNWSSPLVMSPRNSHTLYFGSNHLFKTVDQGRTWRIISPDLTTNDPDRRNPSNQGGLTRNVTGGENHFTIITIGESPIDSAVVWAGTDDGNLQVTQDGGGSWNNVRLNLRGVPMGTWVSRVEPSHHDAGTCYATFDGHRKDDMNPYVFVTRDYGATWRDVTGDLPSGSVYVVREDSHNPDLLFAGTEFGAFATVDRGASWSRLNNNLPTVAVHDLVIHSRDADLVAATHGRSIWILDDITALQQLTPEVRAETLHVFESRRATRWARIDLGRKQPDFLFRGENPPPGGLIHFYLKDAPAGPVQVVVEDASGGRTWSVTSSGPGTAQGAGNRGRGGRNRGRGGRGGRGRGGRGGGRGFQPTAGLNRVTWNLTFPSTQQERAAMQNRLGRAVTILASEVRTEEDRQELDRIARAVAQATDDGSLNRVRSDLVGGFAAYAGGRPIFGPSIAATPAPAGTYRVTVRMGALESTSQITVRDDPLSKR